MIRYGLVLALFLLQIGGKGGVGGKSGVGGGVSGCAAPTAFETSQWPVYGAGVTCVTACGSGVAINLIPDTVGSLNLAGNTGSYAEPTYLPSAFGTLAAAAYSNPSGMALGAGIPTSVTSTSFWATLAPSGGARGIVGGPASAFEWRITTGGCCQEVLVSGVSVIGHGSAAFTNGAKYTVAVTVNSVTGAWALYTMSGGVVTSDGSGTIGAITFGAPITDFGTANGTADGFQGNIVDAGYFAGIWNSTALNAIAAWSNCNAGV